MKKPICFLAGESDLCSGCCFGRFLSPNTERGLCGPAPSTASAVQGIFTRVRKAPDARRGRAAAAAYRQGKAYPSGRP